VPNEQNMQLSPGFGLMILRQPSAGCRVALYSRCCLLKSCGSSFGRFDSATCRRGFWRILSWSWRR